MILVQTQKYGTCNILGCTDPIAANYLADANQDDGSCVSTIIYGCMDPSAINYDSSATVNQSSADNFDDPCIPFVPGCTNPNFVEYYDYEYNDTLKYQISGPVDTANQDNGSCVTKLF